MVALEIAKGSTDAESVTSESTHQIISADSSSAE